MWHLKFETQGHSTEDTGLTFETPEAAYTTVEILSNRAECYEQECYDADDGLEYDPIPENVADMKAWLEKQGWPEGCVPVIYHDDGRIMVDMGEGEFTEYEQEE